MLNDTPFCDRQDCRIHTDSGSITSAYYEPVFDKKGVNLNPDRNTTTTYSRCSVCGKSWRVESINGNSTIHDLRG